MGYKLDHEENVEQTHGQSTALRNNLHHVRTLREKLAEKRTVIMLVATVIATLTFQAALSPPGGVWQENSPEHKAGEAVMAYNHPDSYATFYIADLIGFVASLSTIFLLITVLTSRHHFLSDVLVAALIGVMCLTIVSVLVIVSVSIGAITPKKVEVQQEIHSQTWIIVGIIVYCILMISPITALVAMCFMVPRSTVDVNSANGDEEAVDVSYVNGDEEDPQLKLM